METPSLSALVLSRGIKGITSHSADFLEDSAPPSLHPPSPRGNYNILLLGTVTGVRPYIKESASLCGVVRYQIFIPILM